MAPTLRQLATACAGLILCAGAWAQSAAQSGRPPAVIPLESEPAPKLVAYPPLASALARGVAIIQFRTEHLRVLPVFGRNAVDVSPQLGHVHLTVDDWPGTWAHTSQDPIILVGLKPGAHKVVLELADPNHKILAREEVVFTVAGQDATAPHRH
jgi:hypothetical protein